MDVSSMNAVDVERPRDDTIREQLEAQLHEAAERITFHRVETERWERIGRSCAAAMGELMASRPVEGSSPGQLMEAASPQTAQAMPDMRY